MELGSGTLRFGTVGYAQLYGSTNLTGGGLSSGGPVDLRNATLGVVRG